ncbi:MAG TPA: flagellar hook-associated protein 3 [Treponema sp.]|jgi:flagellar hook-associated protein 3 FlgL|nr:flagellar hook-associated protein 3 [Treponema sp.]HCA19903.1 flagellar hook-associated protein 3 [Treponema sp.]
MNRISSQYNNTNTQYFLRQQEVRQAQKNAQIGSQSRLGALRDDPIAAGHLVRYQSFLSRVNVFEKNAQTLADNFQLREGYIHQNVEIMQKVRELAVQGANGTYTPQDLKNMSVQVDELLKELIQNANAVGPDGNSLFAGTRNNVTSFEISMGDVEGASEPLITHVAYNGNIEANKVEVDEQAYLEVENSGNKIFWAEPQVLMGQRDLSSWQAQEDSVIYLDGVDIRINRGDNIYAVAAKINDSGVAVKASIDPLSRGLNLRTTDAHQMWLADKSGSVLEQIGMIKDKSQLPPYNIGTSVNISGGSLFDTVIALRDALLSGNQEAIGSRVLGTIDEGMNNLTTRLAKSGSDYERAQNNIQRQSLNNLNVTNLVSREGDIDMTEAITDLKMLDYVHQATLSTAGRLYSSTLLDYVR